MLKFFRRFRRKLLDEGSLGKYLIYATGEILLIVIGILLALQISSWNESNKKRQQEISALEQLIESLDTNLKDLNKNIRSTNKSISSISILQTHLQNDLSYHDTLSQHFGNSSTFVNYIVNSSVYDNIKSSGLEVISNNSLRNRLVAHFDYFTSSVKSSEEVLVNPHYSSIVIPTMIKKFDYSWIVTPAIPNNYENLKNDHEYLSLLKTTKSLRVFHLRYIQNLVEDAQLLQNQLRSELDKLKR